MIKLDAVINDKKLLDSIQKGVDQFNKSRSGKSKLDLKINEKGFRQPLGRITGDLDKFESALAASNARVIAFGASTAVIGGITKAFKELTATTINVQKQFADINRILGATNEKFEAFGNSLFNIGKQTATAFDDVSKAALEFARQGLGMEETLKRTADALTLVRLTGVNADKAVSALTATVNAFQLSAITTTDAVNKFVAVETKFAVGARDLMDALGRVGSAAVDAKVNFDELNAMVAAVQQQTGRGGAVIGNALKTIFTRLQRKDTLAALESYGIAVRDVQGSTLPAMRILKQFASTYKTLEDSSKSYLREQVAGVFQANILSAIVKDLNSGFQVYNRALETSIGATNEADTANAKLNRTLSALISQTGTELVRLQENIGKVTLEPIARALLGPFKGIIESINNVLDGEGLGAGFANGFLKGLRNIIAGPGMVAAIAVVGTTIFKTLGYITKALPTLVGITTETKKRANIEQTIVAMMQQDAGLATQIARAEGDAAKQAGILLAAADKQAIAFKSSEGSISRMAAMLATMGMTTGKMGTLAPKGKGAFGRGATGYIPGITGEMHDIAQGIGGVSSSAKPVHIPNFAFGGGVTGSMVANTGEHVVPNFRGSASAIFNPNMVGAFGLPQGAQKITASQGYVPNFAAFSFGTAAGSSRVTASGVANTPIGDRYGGKAVTAADQNSANSWLKANPAQKGTGAKLATGLQRRQVAGKKYGISVNAATDLELGAIVGIQNMGATRNVSQPFSKIKTIAGAKTASYIPRLEATFGKNWPKARLHLQGIPVKAIPGKVTEEQFRAKMNTHMGPSLHNLAADLFGTSAFKTDKEATAYIQGLKSGTAVFSKQAEGGIFESALKMTKASANKFGGLSEQAQIDFNEVGPMDAALKKRFFPLLGPGMRADAKRTDELENIQSLAGKALGDPLMGAELVKRFFLTPRGSRGYVPNFAGGGLGAAIQREKKAGVPGSSIRIKSSPRFSTSQNPAGLAVTNTRDEPRGLRDIPNFADPIRITAADIKTPKPSSGMGGFAMMMGAPMLGGMVEQGVGGRGGSLAGGALTGLGTGAGIGSMILPVWGTAIGAVVGALGGVAVAAVASGQSLDSLAKELDDFETRSMAIGAAGEGYIQALEDITLATNERDLASATKQAEKAMKALAGTDLEKDFLDAGTNVEEMTRRLKGFTDEVAGERALRRGTLGLVQYGDEKAFTTAPKEGVFRPKRSLLDKARNRGKTWGEGKLELPMTLEEFKAKKGRKPVWLDETMLGREGRSRFDSEKYARANREMVELLVGGMAPEDVEKLQKRLANQLMADVNETTLLKDFQELGSEGVKDLTGSRLELFEAFIKGLDNMNSVVAIQFVGQFDEMQKQIKDRAEKGGVTSIIDNTAKIQKEFLQTISGLMDPYLNLMTNISSMNTAVGINIAERAAIVEGRLSLLKGTLAPTAEVDMRRGNAATAITQKRSVASAAFYKNNLNKIKTAMSERTTGRGAVGAQELTSLLNTFITGGPQAGIGAMRAAAGPMAGGKVEFEAIQKAAADMQVSWDKAKSVIDKEERLNKIKFTIEELKARNLEREREMIIQQQQLSNAAKVNIAERQAGADLDIARLQFQLGDDRTFRGMSGVQRIGRKAEIEQNIRNIQRGMALTELEQDQKEKAQDLKMREQLLAQMKEETDTNLEQIEAIKVEISLTKEMITKQEQLIQALKENTAALRKEEEGPKIPKGAAGGGWGPALNESQKEWLQSDDRRDVALITQSGGPGRLKAAKQRLAKGDDPGRRKELEKEATHLKAIITRDQAVSPEQQETKKARQEQLKKVNRQIGALPGLGLLDTPRGRFLFAEWEKAGKPSTFEKWVNTEGVNILNSAVVQGKAPPPKPPKPQRKHRTSWWSDSLDPALSDLGRISPDWTPGGPGAPGRALDPALVAIGRISPDWTPGESVARGGARTTGIPGTGGGGVGGDLGPNQIQLTEIENTRQALVDLSNSEFESIQNTARGLLDNYDTEKKIFKVREDGKDAVEETLKLLRQQKYLQDTTFKGGWGKGMDKVRMDSETIFSLLGERLPVQMRDGMVTAMEAALDGAESFGDAMEGVAVGLLRSIRQAFLTSAATSIVGMFPGGKGNTGTNQKGGFIRAQNGMFVSGSGNGDRYPSLLEAGEYVLNRNAVSALGGPGALDTLNFGAAPRFQAGGGHRMNLAEKLPSTRMSGLFLSQGNPEYDDIAAAAVARLQKKQEKYQEKEDFKALLMSTLISAGISAAAGYAGSKWGSGANKPPVGTTRGVDASGRDVSIAPDWIKPTQIGGSIGRQTGGLVGSTVRRYGLYQGGGSVPVAGGASALGGGGNTNNISINIDLGGNATGGGTGGSQGPTGNSGAAAAESQNPADAKALGEKIKSQVLKVIAQEQRVGGSLSPSARKGG